MVPAQLVREYLYAFAGVCPFTGQLDAVILPEVNAAAMSLFLEEVAAQHPGEQVAAIMDQAGWHKARDVVVPANITLCWLPPYSPELNPVEHLWKEIRQKWFPNQAFHSLDEVMERLSAALKSLMDSPAIVQSMSRFSWMET